VFCKASPKHSLSFPPHCLLLWHLATLLHIVAPSNLLQFPSTTVQGVLQDVELNQRMTEVCRQAVRAFVEDRTDKDGRVSIKGLNKFAQMTGLGAQEPWVSVIKVCLLSVPPEYAS